MKNNNVDKDIYNAPTVKEEVRKSIKLASETPLEEFEMDLLQTLSQYEKWKENNPGKSYDDFLKDVGLSKRVELNKGGSLKVLSREAMLDMLKSEYPKIYYKKGVKEFSDEQLKTLLDNLDTSGVPFNDGGLVSNFKKNLRRP